MLSSAKIVSMTVGLLVNLLIMKSVAPKVLGEFAYEAAIVGFVGPLFTYRLGDLSLAQREIKLGTINGILIIQSALMFGFGCGFIYMIGASSLVFIYLLGIVVFYMSETFTRYFERERRFKRVLFIETFAAFFYLITAIILYKIDLLVVALYSRILIQGLFSLVFIIPSINFVRPSFSLNEIRIIMPNSIKLWADGILEGILNRQIPIYAISLGGAYAGNFANAQKYVMIPNSVLSSVMSRLTLNFGRHSAALGKRRLYSVLIFTLMTLASYFALVYTISYVSSDWTDSSYIFVSLVPWVVVNILFEEHKAAMISDNQISTLLFVRALQIFSFFALTHLFRLDLSLSLFIVYSSGLVFGKILASYA